MTPTPRKFLFDECIGKPHIQSLAGLVSISEEASAEIKHVLDFQKQGVRDEEWIPRIKSEGWIVVTQDKSRHQTKGQPLSRVCVANGVTHIILSRRISSRRSFDKMMTVLNLWYEILDLVNAKAGSRYVIEPLSSDPKDRGHGKLIERLMPEKKLPPGVLFDKHGLPEDDAPESVTAAS